MFNNFQTYLKKCLIFNFNKDKFWAQFVSVWERALDRIHRERGVPHHSDFRDLLRIGDTGVRDDQNHDDNDYSNCHKIEDWQLFPP